MNKLRTIISAFTLTIALFSLTSSAFAIGAAPLRIQVQGAPGETIETKVRAQNTQEDAILVNLTKGDFYIREDESLQFFYEYDENNKRSMQNWIEFTENDVLLEGKQAIEIPYNINIPEDAETGGYYGVVFVGTKNSDTFEGNGVAVQSVIAQLILVEVTGGLKTEIEVQDINIDEENNINTVLFNKGNTHDATTGKIIITDRKLNQLEEFQINKTKSNTLPDRQKTFTNEWDRSAYEPGLYYAYLDVQTEKEDSITAELKFEIFEDGSLENLKLTKGRSYEFAKLTFNDSPIIPIVIIGFALLVALLSLIFGRKKTGGSKILALLVILVLSSAFAGVAWAQDAATVTVQMTVQGPCNWDGTPFNSNLTVHDNDICEINGSSLDPNTTSVTIEKDIDGINGPGGTLKVGNISATTFTVDGVITNGGLIEIGNSADPANQDWDSTLQTASSDNLTIIGNATTVAAVETIDTSSGGTGTNTLIVNGNIYIGGSSTSDGDLLLGDNSALNAANNVYVYGAFDNLDGTMTVSDTTYVRETSGTDDGELINDATYNTNRIDIGYTAANGGYTENNGTMNITDYFYLSTTGSDGTFTNTGTLNLDRTGVSAYIYTGGILNNNTSATIEADGSTYIGTSTIDGGIINNDGDYIVTLIGGYGLMVYTGGSFNNDSGLFDTTTGASYSTTQIYGGTFNNGDGTNIGTVDGNSFDVYAGEINNKTGSTLSASDTTRVFETGTFNNNAIHTTTNLYVGDNGTSETGGEYFNKTAGNLSVTNTMQVWRGDFTNEDLASAMSVTNELTIFGISGDEGNFLNEANSHVVNVGSIVVDGYGNLFNTGELANSSDILSNGDVTINTNGEYTGNQYSNNDFDTDAYITGTMTIDGTLDIDSAGDGRLTAYAGGTLNTTSNASTDIFDFELSGDWNNAGDVHTHEYNYPTGSSTIQSGGKLTNTAAYPKYFDHDANLIVVGTLENSGTYSAGLDTTITSGGLMDLKNGTASRFVSVTGAAGSADLFISGTAATPATLNIESGAVLSSIIYGGTQTTDKGVITNNGTYRGYTLDGSTDGLRSIQLNGTSTFTNTATGDVYGSVDLRHTSVFTNQASGQLFSTQNLNVYDTSTFDNYGEINSNRWMYVGWSVYDGGTFNARDGSSHVVQDELIVGANGKTGGTLNIEDTASFNVTGAFTPNATITNEGYINAVGEINIDDNLNILDGGAVDFLGAYTYDVGSVEMQSDDATGGNSTFLVDAGATLNITDAHDNCQGNAGYNCSLEIGTDTNAGGFYSEIAVDGTLTIPDTASNYHVEIGGDNTTGTEGNGDLIIGEDGIFTLNEGDITVNVNGDGTNTGVFEVDGYADLAGPLNIDGEFIVDTDDADGGVNLNNNKVDLWTLLTLDTNGIADQGMLSTVTVEGSDTYVYGDYELDGTLNSGNLTVYSGGLIHSSGDDESSTATNFYINADNVDVQTGGAISSDLVSSDTSAGGGAGSHGGEGEGRTGTGNTYGKAKLDEAGAGSNYGDSTNAPEYGQQGVGGVGPDGKGGGGVRIYSDGDINIDGTVSADGGPGTNAIGAGGAGGKVIIVHNPSATTAVFTGGGTISANGGDEGAGSIAGGGGRVIIKSPLLDDPDLGNYDFGEDGGTVSAYPGAGGGAAGTVVYLGDRHNDNTGATVYGTLIVDQNSVASSIQTEIANSGNYEFARVEAKNDAELTYNTAPTNNPTSCWALDTSSASVCTTTNDDPDKPDTLNIGPDLGGSTSGGEPGVQVADGVSNVVYSVADLTPQISAIYRNPSAEAATKMQIQVDDTADFSSTLWDYTKTSILDSGGASLTDGERSEDVEYQGTALTATGGPYFIRAKFYDADDNPGLWTHGDYNSQYKFEVEEADCEWYLGGLTVRDNKVCEINEDTTATYITIEKDLDASTVGGTLKVGKTDDLTAGSVTLTVNGPVTNGGDIEIGDPNTTGAWDTTLDINGNDLTIEGNGTKTAIVKTYANTSYDNVIDVNGTINVGTVTAAQGTLTLGDDSTTNHADDMEIYGTFNNDDGTMEVKTGTVDFRMYSGATVDNSGTLNVEATTDQLYFIVGDGSTFTNNATGLVHTTELATKSEDFNIQGTFDNDGTLTVDEGIEIFGTNALLDNSGTATINNELTQGPMVYIYSDGTLNTTGSNPFKVWGSVRLEDDSSWTNSSSDIQITNEFRAYDTATLTNNGTIIVEQDTGPETSNTFEVYDSAVITNNATSTIQIGYILRTGDSLGDSPIINNYGNFYIDPNGLCSSDAYATLYYNTTFNNYSTGVFEADPTGFSLYMRSDDIADTTTFNNDNEVTVYRAYVGGSTGYGVFNNNSGGSVDITSNFYVRAGGSVYNDSGATLFDVNSVDMTDIGGTIDSYFENNDTVTTGTLNILDNAEFVNNDTVTLTNNLSVAGPNATLTNTGNIAGSPSQYIGLSGANALVDNQTGGQINTTNLTVYDFGTINSAGQYDVTNYVKVLHGGGSINLTDTSDTFNFGSLEVQAESATAAGDSSVYVGPGATLQINNGDSGCQGNAFKYCSLEIGTQTNLSDVYSYVEVDGTLTIPETATDYQIEVGGDGNDTDWEGTADLIIGEGGTFDSNENNITTEIMNVGQDGLFEVNGYADLEHRLYIAGWMDVDLADTAGGASDDEVHLQNRLTVADTGTIDQGMFSEVWVDGSDTYVYGFYQLDGTLHSGDLTVYNGGLMSSGGRYAPQTSTNFYIDAHNVDVQTGGAISSDYASWIDRPGTNRGGGSYGGEGRDQYGSPSATYGATKATSPLYGERGEFDFGDPRGRGGGGVEIYADGNITIDGIVSAKGEGRIRTLGYTGQTTNFTVGDIIEGATSGTTAVILHDDDAGATGTLYIGSYDDYFTVGETINGDSGGDGTTTTAGVDNLHASGAGGTVIITQDLDPITDTGAFFRGSGEISAMSRGSVYNGGGGRIVIDSPLIDDPDLGSYDFGEDGGTITANGGDNGANNAAAGTIVFLGDRHNPNGTLIIEQNGPATIAGLQTDLADTPTFDRIEVRKSDIAAADADLTGATTTACYNLDGSSVTGITCNTSTSLPDKPDSLHIEATWTGTTAGTATEEPGYQVADGVSNTVYTVGDIGPVFAMYFRNPGDTTNEHQYVEIQVDDTADFSSPIWDATGANAIDLGSTASEQVKDGEWTRDIEYDENGVATSGLTKSTTYYVRARFKDGLASSPGLWSHGDYNSQYKFTPTSYGRITVENCNNGGTDLKVTQTGLSGGADVTDTSTERFGWGDCEVHISTSDTTWNVDFGMNSSEGGTQSIAYNRSPVNASFWIDPIDNAGDDCTINPAGTADDEEYGYNIFTYTDTTDNTVMDTNTQTDTESMSSGANCSAACAADQSYNYSTASPNVDDCYFDVEISSNLDTLIDVVGDSVNDGIFDFRLFHNVTNTTPAGTYTLDGEFTLSTTP